MIQRSAQAETLSHLSARVRRHIRTLGFADEKSYFRWCKEAGFTARTNKNADQMKREVQRRRSDESGRNRQSSLKAHIMQLGFGSIQSYQAWCRRGELGDGLHKSAAQRAKELRLMRRGSQSVSTDKSRKLRRELPKTFWEIADGRIKKRELTDPVLIRLHELLQANRDPAVRNSFLELLKRVDQVGHLIDISPVIDRLGRLPTNTMLDGYLALATHCTEWRRPVESWNPSTKSRRQAFAELARHLLADYPVPSFMDSAWFAGVDAAAIKPQGWFCHIGRGKNIRTADTPIQLTKHMAHLFLDAPGEYSICEALRWSQILGLGGDQEMADHIIRTRLGESLENDKFWVDVVHFFVNNPMLDYDQYGPLVDYIHSQRYVPIEKRLDDGTVVDEPPQPTFSMKGRTVERLLSQVDTWHNQLAREKKSPHTTWPRSGIRPFEKLGERNGRVIRWTISEIASRKELLGEGRVMHHCVASYAKYCARGQKSVWSLSVEDVGTGYSDRVMTIAISNANRRVVQARGRCNALPGVHIRDSAANRVLKTEGDRLKLGRAVMRQWGDKESITVPRVT